jgi:hypothetical protein
MGKKRSVITGVLLAVPLLVAACTAYPPPMTPTPDLGRGTPLPTFTAGPSPTPLPTVTQFPAGPPAGQPQSGGG